MDSGDVPVDIDVEMDADINLKNENGNGLHYMDDGGNDLEDALAGGDSEKHVSNGVDLDFESDFNAQLNDLNRSSGVGLSKPIWSPSQGENVPQNGDDLGHGDEYPEDLEGGGGEGFIDPDTDIATEGSLDLEVEQGGDMAAEGLLDFDVEVPDHHHHMAAPYMPEQEPRDEGDIEALNLEHPEEEPFQEPPQESPPEPPQELIDDQFLDPFHQSPVHDPYQEPYFDPAQEQPMQEQEQESLQEPLQDPFDQPQEEHFPQSVEDTFQQPLVEPFQQPFVEPLQQPLDDPSEEAMQEPIRELSPEPAAQEPFKEPMREPLQQEPLLGDYEDDLEARMEDQREIDGAEQDQHLPDDGFIRDDEAGAMTEGSLDLDVGVGGHVNEVDDDADVFEATERLDSPASPPYVNTTIISNASSALEPAPAHAQSLIPRSLDDVSGDATASPERRGGSGRIPTGAEEAITVVEPTAETELLENKGNGDAYVPMDVVRKGFPPPFPIGYSDENLSKGNWGHKMEFLCAIFCVVFNFASFIYFPITMHKNGGVVFLIPYMIILFVLMLPLILAEISLGQFASSSFLTSWKFCPLLKGLSMGMLLQLFGLCFWEGPVSSYSLYFMYSVFMEADGQMVYTTCSHSWNTPECKPLFPPPPTLGGNDSMGSNYTFVTDIDNTVPMDVTNANFAWVSPEEQYYRNHVLMMAEGTTDQGPPVTHLMICLGVAWAIAFFIMLFGIKSFGKVAYALVGFHVLLLFVLLIRGAVLDGALAGLKILFWPNVHKLLEPMVWLEALLCAMKTFYPMCGIYMSLSSYSKFHNNCFMDSVVLILVALFINLLSAVAFFTYIGYGITRLGWGDYNFDIDNKFVLLLMLIGSLPNAQIISFILFVFTFLSSLSFQIVLALSIAIGFLDAIGYRHSWKAIVPSCFIICLACFGGGLLFITPEGDHYLSVMDMYFLPHIPFILCIIVPLSLTWIYGTIPQWKFLRFQGDIKCMVGCFPIIFQGLFAGLEAIVIPLVMGLAWGYFLYVRFHNLNLMEAPYQGWHIAVGVIVAIVPLIIGFLSGAVMELCKHIRVYRYFTELFWLAAMPLREWGPAVDELREEHGYPPLKEERDDLVEEYREGTYSCENINNANGIETDQRQQQQQQMRGSYTPVYQGGSYPPSHHGGSYSPSHQGGSHPPSHFGGSYPPSPHSKQEMAFPDDSHNTSNELDQTDRDNPVNSNATLPAGTPLLGLSLCSHETTL